MFNDEYWMEKALMLADQAASEGEVPVGAILVLGNEIIGQGYNSPISCCDPTAHAEIQAIRDACQKQANYRLPKASLYVTVEPCSMCAGAIVHARIERVVYAATEPKSGAVESQNRFFEQDFLNHSVKVETGVLGTLASQKMSDFFQFRREQKKKIRTASKLALEQKKSS